MGKMREEFEAWYQAESCAGSEKLAADWLKREPCGGYTYAEPADDWRVWQASRAALVVELPSPRSLSASDDPWLVRDWCKDAIEAAGVNVAT